MWEKTKTGESWSGNAVFVWTGCATGPRTSNMHEVGYKGCHQTVGGISSLSLTLEGGYE